MISGGNTTVTDFNNPYIHAAYPSVESINRIPLNSSATNMQNAAMLKYQNLLDPTFMKSATILQNPIAQILPATLPGVGTGNQNQYAFSL